MRELISRYKFYLSVLHKNVVVTDRLIDWRQCLFCWVCDRTSCEDMVIRLVLLI